MKKISLFFSLSFFSIIAYSQSGFFFVRGIVADSKTKAPLKAVAVFAQNTTMGTVTDSKGNFSLQLPYGGYDIVIASTAYFIQVKHISSSDTSNTNFTIALKQKPKSFFSFSLISRDGDRNGLDKYGDIFADNFKGKNFFSRDCHILNPEVLQFYYNKRKKKLRVAASAPLEMQTNALGYKIKYILDSFVYDFNTESSVFSGYSLFEEMKSTNDRQMLRWKSNRLQTYNGSILHFMRSIYNQSLADDGFEMEQVEMKNGKNAAEKISDYYTALNYSKNDSTQVVLVKPGNQKLAIIFGNEEPEKNYLAIDKYAPTDYQLSIITFQHPIKIEANGYYYNPADITFVSGYWAWGKLANLLPLDYVPE